MRFFTFFLTFLVSVTVRSEVKDVLKKVPKRIDTVIKLNVKDFMDIAHVRQILGIMTELKEPMAQFRNSLGINLQDLKSVYLCGNLKQFFDSKGNVKGDWEINNMFRAGKFDVMLFAELYKPLNLEKLQKSLPGKHKVIEIGNVKCIRLDEKEMQYPHAAFFSPRFVGLASENLVKEIISMAPDKTILENKKIVELLKENGFGGIISIVHAGKFIKVPEMTPWVKDYRGGVLNAWFKKKEGAEVQLTTNFQTLEAVRNASMMAQLGLNFLDTKPELKLIKEGITIKVEGNNLLIDLKMKNSFFEELIADKMTGSLVEARHKAKIAHSMNNQKQLILALMKYSNDNENKMPDNLNELKEYIGGNGDLKKMLTCPVTSQEYTYIKPQKGLNEIKNPSKTVVLFSKTKNGTISAYIDGHVEFSKNESK